MSHPANLTVDINAAAVLSCSATSYSNLTITWKKVGFELPITATTNTIKLNNNVTSVLTISKMVMFYGGLYYCIASNSIGETHSIVSNLIVKGKLHILEFASS